MNPIIRTLETLCGVCVMVCVLHVVSLIAAAAILWGDLPPSMRLPYLLICAGALLVGTFFWAVLYAVLKSLAVGLTLLASINKQSVTSAQNSYVLASRP
jgi:hypothetical protein